MDKQEFPDDLAYTSDHEWVRRPGGVDGSVRVGITDFAQQALGDIVFVSLPEVGVEVQAGAPCGELESTKSVSDLFAPITGTVVARNEALEEHPELVNSAPYGDGWMIELRPAEAADLASLLDAEAYRAEVQKA
jgi:glycine cleavage system H protein